MAYFLYCNSCKQWNKSAAPLEIGKSKSCPHCGNTLVKINPNIILNPAINSEEEKVEGDDK